MSRNPQANSILEGVHQTIGNSIHTFMVLDDKYSCDRILTSTMFVLHSTVHTMMLHTHSQSVLRQDCMLITSHKVTN